MRLSSALWWSTYLGTAVAAAATVAGGYDVLEFDWDSIIPSASLAWHPCYGNGEFRCARLLVPLDWKADPDGGDDDDDGQPDNNNKVAIAMIKLPAAVPDDDPSFGGTIFTNPGGPGGSGVRHALANAHTMRDIADRPESDDGRRRRRHYEILSWDPRGVLFTTPQANCFEGDLAARYAANLQRDAIGSLGGGLDVVRRQHARARGFGSLCERGVGAHNGSSILPFASTASVVRDMVEMVDKIHELRREEAGAAAAAGLARTTGSDGGGGGGGGGEPQRPLELRGEKRREGKVGGDDVPRIQYWGFSYGSVLGNAFASMYPGRVGRMIVDGIADADDYMAGTWLANLQDTEKIVEYFYASCFSAGPELCPLRRRADASWATLRSRVDALAASLDARPAVLLSQRERASIVTVTGYEVLSAFRRPLYQPAREFPLLARALADAVDDRNYTRVLELQYRWSPPRLGDTCLKLPPNSSIVATRSEPDAARAIMCSDGDDMSGMEAADWQAYVDELVRQSPTFGPYWASFRFECSGWKVRPKWRFTGPFGTPPPLSQQHDARDNHGHDLTKERERENEEGRDGDGDGDGDGDRDRPSAPLLFVSSRLDPVTPLRNAHRMAALHPGSAVLEVDAVGHCGSVVPSACAREVIREYLESGAVPRTGGGEEAFRCGSEFDPWAPEEEEEEVVVEGMEGMEEGKKGGGRRRRRRRRGFVDLQVAWPEMWV